MPGMTSGLSRGQKSRHSSYLYPLWRFLSKIGCPVFVSWAGAALHKKLLLVLGSLLEVVLAGWRRALESWNRRIG